MARNNRVRIALVCWALGASPFAWALQSDRQQEMLIDANYQKTTQSQTNTENDPDITNLDGNVVITQGSLKSHGDHAIIYKNPTGIADESGNIGGIRRIIITGKSAHLEQVHDIDCSLMTADALKIDYNNITGIAVLTSNVVVIQKGKSEFHGENMIYNTVTGEMESGDKDPSSRVHMVMQPSTHAPPSPAAANNCGFPGAPKTKTDKAAKADKAAAKS
jgi:lipopolysaccharide export system protein LptA